MVAGLRSAAPVPAARSRMPLRSGAVLVDDSYNANPGSVAAAIDTLAQAGRTRHLAGARRHAELGETAALLHADIGASAKARRHRAAVHRAAT